MKPGSVVLIELPQSNGQLKKRPALLLKQMPGYGDWLVCGISTQLHQCVKGFDEILEINHPDYKNSGLKNQSLIRLAFVAIIPSANIPGVIGTISNETHKNLLKRLSEHLLK